MMTNVDVCSQKCSGHKAVKFGGNTYRHGDNLKKNHSVLRGQIENVSLHS
jgi:hypothetical protein